MLRPVALIVVLAALLPAGGAVLTPTLAPSPPGAEAQVRILVMEPEAAPAVLAQLRSSGIAHRHYEHLHMAAAWLDAEQEAALARTPGVEGVHPVQVARPYLAQSAKYIGAEIAWSTYRTTGTGVGILIVDTGVDGSHPDVLLGKNLVENVAPRRQIDDGGLGRGLVTGYQEGVQSTDVDGHGTHAASIAGGLGVGSGGSDRGKYRGIAHGASLIGFQAGIRDLQSGETGFDTPTVLEAFNYALEKRDEFNIRVVSNSWGLNGEFSDRDPVNIATLALYRAGIVVVFAGGNEGDQGPGHMNMYSVAPWVLSVAAGDYFNQPTSFSSKGSGDPRKPYDRPDLMAPGAGITAARAAPAAGPAGSVVPGGAGTPARGDLYTVKSGTSMAAPHVAGAAALLLSYDPSLSPDNVYDVLVASATPVPRVPLSEGGAGYLNMLKALQVAETVQGNRAQFLAGQTKYSKDNLSADPVTVGLYGRASSVGGVDADLGELARGLVGTWQGLLFLGGSAVLSLLAFRPQRRDAP